MVKQLSNIFLSASIPAIGEPFYDTTDVIAIRDSVKALATVVLPKAHLIWGGHPAITPLIRNVFLAINSEINIKKHVTLYQSEYFVEDFPKENDTFEELIITPQVKVKNEKSFPKSLTKMRKQMISENEFKAAIFIGGKQGIIDEYRMFKKYHPTALVLPIASTGGATKKIYDKIYNESETCNRRLLTDYAYMSLFKDYLKEYIE